MARKRPSEKTIAALKAVLVTYENQLVDLLKEVEAFVGQSKKIAKAAANDTTVSDKFWTQFLRLLARRVDVTQKYEAALHDYVQALRARVVELEKKSGEQWREGIEP